MRTHATLCLALALALAAAPASAAPRALGYQGRLLKADGSAATGIIKLGFNVYALEGDANALWSEDQSVPLTDGFYSVYLGDKTALPDGLFDGTERYLEVVADGDVLAPRQRIASVAYALVAQVATDVAGGKVDASAISVGGVPVIDAKGKLAGPARYVAGSGIEIDASNTVSLVSGCARNQVLKFDGAAWACAAAGVQYTVGSGIELVGNTFQLSTTCAAGQLLKWDGAAWGCAADNNQALAAGTGLAASGGTIPLVKTCDPGQLLKWDGTQWACAADAVTKITATAPLVAVGGSAVSLPKADVANDGYLAAADFALFSAKIGTGDPRLADARAPLGAAGGDLAGAYPAPTVGGLLGRPLASTGPANGQVLKWNGAAWAPADDAGLTAITASGPLSGSGTSGAPLTIAKATASTDGYLAQADFSAFSGKLGSVTASGPLSGSGTSGAPLTIAKATASADGYLAQADFSAFSGKLGSVTASGPLSGSGTSGAPLTIAKATASADGYLAQADFSAFSGKLGSVTASGPLSGSGTSGAPLTIAKATASADGYLAQADFSAFSGKLGSVTASGPLSGSGTSGAPLTIAKATASADGYLAQADFSAFSGKLGSVTASGPLSGSGTSGAPLTIAKATASADGYLAQADFSAFSGKLGSVTASGPLSGSGTGASPLALTGTVLVANGGTGSSTGSITGSGALTFAAGGTNQNVTLTPSGTGVTVLNGAVGIGTASPGQKLSVAGTVESTSGGFKFPDGTVQSTAAVGGGVRITTGTATDGQVVSLSGYASTPNLFFSTPAGFGAMASQASNTGFRLATVPQPVRFWACGNSTMFVYSDTGVPLTSITPPGAASANTSGVAYDESNGSLWIVTQSSPALLDNITTAGALVVSFSLNADQIAYDPNDDTLWWTLSSDGILHHINKTNGVLGSITVPGASGIRGVAIDPADGTLWAVDEGAAKMWHVTRAGAVLSSWALPTANFVGVARGRDGTIWASEQTNQRLWQFTLSGQVLATLSEGGNPNFRGIALAVPPTTVSWLAAGN